MRKGRDVAYLLFNSQPFATKLANTLSAWVLVIGDVSAFTSRRAAREEMEYELFGASMICSTCTETSPRRQFSTDERHRCGRTYQCPEVGYLEWRIVTRDTSNLIIFAIDLGAVVYYRQSKTGAVGEQLLTRAYISFPVVSLRIRESSKSKGSSDLLRVAKKSLQPSAEFVFAFI